MFRRWSIERRPPLLVSLLLLIVAGALLAIGYREVRRAARLVASARVTHAANVIADLLRTSLTQQRASLQRIVNDSGVRDLVATSGRRGRVPALAALRRVVPDTSRIATVEIVAGNGESLLRSGRFSVRPQTLETAAGKDSVAIGPFVLQDTVIFYEATAPITAGTQRAMVRQTARIQLNAQTRTALTGLAGGDVVLLMGNATGDPWVDFGAIVPAPPDFVRESDTAIRYERGDTARRARVVPVQGTPWMVGAELRAGAVASPAAAYVRRMLPLTAIVLLLGALIAWWGSHLISSPLRDVRQAAEALAGGEWQRRVEESGPDEIRSLARSFNTMAERIANSQQLLERQVADRTQALQATNAELEAFSYSVSHDLRAPLRAIHGFARILTEDHKDGLDPEAQRLLGVIDQNTRRMGQLIDDLLAFSRLGRQELLASPVDMDDLTRKAIEEARRGDGERAVELTMAPLPAANGDRVLLFQVMQNLVQNAFKFTRKKDAARIEIGTQPDGSGHNVYYVKDNGAGFDERYADKLFGVFQRLHSMEEFEGTGVGLAIVKRIVQRHGGRVWAQGQVDGGATFYFTLPRGDKS